ncbi:MAG: hypothetical protein ABI165_14685 [Bryobacteraceae bacterium]
MKSAILILLLSISFALPGRAHGTSAGPASASASAAASDQGVPADWDVKTLLDSLGAEAQRLKPILDQLKPQDWVAQGAPQGYVAQWKTAENELNYLLGSTTNLQKQPERLTLALEAYFRMQALDTTLDSLIDGIRKYHNPAVADLLKAVMTENSNNREKLRLYIVDLAGSKEQEFKVVDEEAQRCRGMLSRQPPPRSAPATKR